MKHRCYNCKCLEEESTFKAHIRKKHDLNARFYCKKCNKDKPQVQSFKDVCRIEILPKKKKIPRRRFEQDVRKIVTVRKSYSKKERFKKASEGLTYEEGIAIGRFFRKCPPGYQVVHIIPISKGGLHRLSNLQYFNPLENMTNGVKFLAEEQKTAFAMSDASKSTSETGEGEIVSPVKRAKSCKYKKLRRERKTKHT